MMREKILAIVVVGVYVLLLPGMSFLAWKFMNNTGLTFIPPKGTIVYDAIENAEKYFPYQIPINPLYMLITSQNTSKSILENPHFEPFCHYLLAQVTNKSSPFFGVVKDVLGYVFIPSFSEMRSRFIGGNHNESSLLLLNIPSTMKTTIVLPNIKPVIDTWCDENGVTFTREYTSTDLVSGDASGGIVEDLLRVDAISLPIAFLVLVFGLKSVRLLLIPLITLPCSIIIAFGLMYPISLCLEISSFAPEMTLGVMAALSIDYSLFILTRFREQVQQQEHISGVSPETEWTVVKDTTLLSASNISVSGCCIAFALGSLSWIPISFLSTIGLTMCVAILCTVIVSLTLQPALLFIFYNFFAHQPTWREVWRKLLYYCSCGYYQDYSHHHSNEVTIYNSFSTTNSLREELLVNEEGDDVRTSDKELAELKKQMTSYWFYIGWFSFRYPIIVTIAILAFGASFFYFALQMRVDFDIFKQIPRGSPHGKVLQRIENTIGGGSSIPFHIIFSVRGSYDISFWKTEDMTNTMRSVIDMIIQETGQSYSSITSPNMIMKSGYSPNNNNVTWLKSWESFLLYSISKEYQYLVNRTVSIGDKKSAYFLLFPHVSPFGSSANSYLNTINNILEKHASENVFFDYGILGASSASWSIMKKLMEFFFFIVGLTFGGIFIIMLIIFRSLLLPFRLLFTVTYTLGFSYGVGVIAFQYKWLYPLWKDLDHVENYSFLIPLFTFLLISALSLDYDVFLTTRIIEFKEKGHTDEAAVAKAVWKTGPVISFAGLIMFVTIGSMVFSSIMMLSQFAVVCGAAVVLDTFVVRPFFVPALMGIGPTKFLWWPRKFPDLRREVDDMRINLDIAAEVTRREEEERGGGGGRKERGKRKESSG